MLFKIKCTSKHRNVYKIAFNKNIDTEEGNFVKLKIKKEIESKYFAVLTSVNNNIIVDVGTGYVSFLINFATREVNIR